MTKEMMLAMLQLQDQMNTQIHPEWRTQGWNFTRAIMHEAIEAQEHIGWKWWKKQDPNIPQLRMELVDIWHFGMSHWIASSPTLSLENLAEGIAGEISAYPVCGMTEPISDVLMDLELLIYSAIDEQGFYVAEFLEALYAAGMTTEMLYKLYIGKNMLNKFRQNNGYKDGTYVKTWYGFEDNEHLEAILIRLEISDSFASQVYRDLQDMYNEFIDTK